MKLKITKNKSSSSSHLKANIDNATVDSFGAEWHKFNQSDLDDEETNTLFNKYFSFFPWNQLPPSSEGFDMGCGSGRWANLVALKVGTLNCIDPSKQAIKVAQATMKDKTNINFINADAESTGLSKLSQDFGYSLGVLHHIPDTSRALQACTKLLKPGAPFLLYLYYKFDNRPIWFRYIWRLSELLRYIISKLPEILKFLITDLIAMIIYFPLAKLSNIIERLGKNPSSIPLSFYRNSSFYTMRTDSRDRFGTPLEQRFSKKEIIRMMEEADLHEIKFSSEEPYWVAIGIKN
jgi:ubiquinone/menaquinone biosynthesis C-methylase UbiE